MSSEPLKIDKPRLICGVLGELAVREIPLEIVDEDDGIRSAFVRFSFELDPGFRKSRIRLGGKQADTVRCKADYFKNTVSFTLSKDDESETYPLPEWIEADHWYIPEIDLPQFEFPTDICYPRGGIMGFAKKLAPDSVVITVDDRDFVPPQDALFHITFRHRTKNESAFHDVMLLERIEQNDSGLDLMFRHVEASPSENETRTEHPVAGLSLDFDSEPFGTHRFCGCIRLETLGLSGFSGGVQGLPNDFLVRGLVLRAKYPTIRFTLERETEERCFFKVVDSDTEWWHFVQFHTDKYYGGNVDPEHLGRLLTESTLLRDRKRRSFGTTIAEQIPYSGPEINPELCRRYVFYSDKSSLPALLSCMFRFSDHSFFWHEGCAGTFPEDMIVFDLYKHAYHKLGENLNIKDGVPQKLVNIFRENIKNNADYCNYFYKTENDFIFEAVHVKASEYIDVFPGIETKNLSMRDVENISQTERYSIASRFHLEILAMLDFWNTTECNGMTNRLLREINIGYGTRLALIEDEIGQPLGLAYRVFSWLATNVSGVMASRADACQSYCPVRTCIKKSTLHAQLFCFSFTLVFEGC